MKHTDISKVKVVIPQVGDLVKAGRTIGVITGFGQWRGGDGEPVWGLLTDGEDWGGVEWDTWAGLARTPKGNYKKKKGQNVSLHKHLVWNEKGYWEQTTGEGHCPLLELWEKDYLRGRGYC